MSKNPLDVYFGLLFRITLKDETLVEPKHLPNHKRIVVGYLLASDKEANVLLNSSKEIIIESSKNERVLKKRYLGMLSVPKSSIEKIEVEKNKYERFSKWQ